MFCVIGNGVGVVSYCVCCVVGLRRIEDCRGCKVVVGSWKFMVMMGLGNLGVVCDFIKELYS